MNIIEVAENCNVKPERLGTNGKEFFSACPMCGGEDRFRMWPDKGEHGTWWCRGCLKKGDAVQLLMDAKGLSFKEAAGVVGKKLQKRTLARSPKAPKTPGSGWTPREVDTPVEIWRVGAKTFMEASAEALLKNREQLAWLAARGIKEDTARRFNLGWNAEDIYREKKAWGLKADGKKLWLPKGLVIPYPPDAPRRIRIRRQEGEPRYVITAGSDMSPMTITPSIPNMKKSAWLIVESELDAVLHAQDAGDVIGVAALGSAQAKPDKVLYGALKDADVILVALDSDENAAGAKASVWWLKSFPQAERWPVPEEKDPSDYRKAGGDIRAWVLAGLPFGLRPRPKAVEPATPPPINDPWVAVDSDVLGEVVIVLRTALALASAIKDNPGLVVYTPKEIAEIKKLAGQNDRLRQIHLAKKILTGWVMSAT